MIKPPKQAKNLGDTIAIGCLGIVYRSSKPLMVNRREKLDFNTALVRSSYLSNLLQLAIHCRPWTATDGMYFFACFERATKIK